MKRLALLLWLVASAAYGQRVTSDIVIHSEPTVSAGSFTLVTVTGLAADEIPKAQIGLVPPDAKILTLRLPTEDGAAFLLAVTKDAAPGVRTFRVSLNPWREHLDAAAEGVSGIEESDVARIKELAAELGKKYTYKFGSAVLEVAGAPFPPGPDPPTPPTPTPGKKRIVILLERGQMTPEQSRTVTALQSGGTAASKYLIAKTHLINVLDDDHPQAQAWLAKLGSQQLPAVIISDAGSSAVSFVGDLPGTADAVIELVKKAGG